MGTLMQRLRERAGIDSIELIKVDILGEGEVVVKQPTVHLIGRVSGAATRDAVLSLSRQYTEAAITALKSQPPNAEAEKERQQQAKEKGIDLPPYSSEYDRLLEEEAQQHLALHMMPYLIVDPDTELPIFENQSDAGVIKDLMLQNPALSDAWSKTMQAYGLRMAKMNEKEEAKKKPTKKQSTSKNSHAG